MIESAHNLALPYSQPTLSACIKEQAEDFEVIENLGFEPSGDGEHLFLWIEKSGCTTSELIRVLSESLQVPEKLISSSGLKDKLAVTRQWISIHLPSVRDIPDIETPQNIQILDADWHHKKLRTGTHRSNHFKIVAQKVNGEIEPLKKVVALIRKQGFANYFGEQRFGVKGDNVELALRKLGSKKKLGRYQKSLYLSALRSDLFNQILHHRIASGYWESPLSGDLWMLNGSQSHFQQPLDEQILTRYHSGDLHSAISLYGTGDNLLVDQARALEDQVFSSGIDSCRILERYAVRRAYRPHRCIPENLVVNFDLAEQVLTISVTLPRGVFMTTLLQHMMNFNAHAT